MPSISFTFRVAVCACAFVLVHHLNVAAGPIVPAYERNNNSLTAEQQASLIYRELNCRSCHEKPAKPEDASNAPVLTNVTNRARYEYLLRYIAEPHQIKAGTRMPDVYAGVAAPIRDEEVKAIVHYLASLASADGRQNATAAGLGSKQRGKTLYHQVGCVACHQAYDNSEQVPTDWPDAVPHGDLASKYSLPSLRDFLLEPLESHPAGRMPSLNLSLAEAEDIASYLLPDVPERGGITFARYHGSWDRLPNFDDLKPVKTGMADRINADVAGRGNHYGLRFDAKILIKSAGEYRFALRSDDGARLFIDQKIVVDNDGVHGATTRDGAVALTAGTHFVRVEYFEQAGGEELDVFVQGPGVDRQPLSALVDRSADAPVTPFHYLTSDEKLARKGRELFSSRGCVACHQVNDETVAPYTPRKISTPTGGCLAETVQAAPEFGLNEQQRKLLQTHVATARHEQKLGSTDAQVRADMLSLNCFACHQRDGVGGVAKERDKYFATTQKEMGDEGRLPPPLDGVGAKLKQEWLAQIIANGAKDRPYMLTRMPRFGKGNTHQLATNLEKDNDALTQLPEISLNRKDARQAGWKMVGEKGGFGCIKCHTFGNYKATGVQSIDMTIMTQRLRKNWFRQYLKNPQIFRRGTRMPSAWPERGKSLLPELLDGDSDQQIAAVWTYLESGTRARLPQGLVTNSMLLMPIEEAIIYRNFIEGAGPRAIAVGFPEGIHLAFDAQQLRLALLWQGTFIDAKRHWTGRGQGFEGPAGDKILRLPSGAAFAYLASDQAWPTELDASARMRFRGYSLQEDQRPTFNYESDFVSIEDTPNAVEHETYSELSRKFVISPRVAPSARPDGTLFLRLAADEKVESPGNDRFVIGGSLQIECELPEGVVAQIATIGTAKELRLALPKSKQPIEFTVKYRW